MPAVVPGLVSLSLAGNMLRRDKKTIRKWCELMGLPVQKIGVRSSYITNTDFERVSQFALANPFKRVQPVPKGRDWDTTEEDTNLDKPTMERRVEAARRWKRRHCGAYIDSAQIIETELAAMAMFPTI